MQREDTHPDHVVHGVDVGVAHVDADGAQGEAEPLPRAVDDHGRPQAADADGQVPAGRRVPGRGVGRQGQGRLGAGGGSS